MYNPDLHIQNDTSTILLFNFQFCFYSEQPWFIYTWIMGRTNSEGLTDWNHKCCLFKCEHMWAFRIIMQVENLPTRSWERIFFVMNDQSQNEIIRNIILHLTICPKILILIQMKLFVYWIITVGSKSLYCFI